MILPLLAETRMDFHQSLLSAQAIIFMDAGRGGTRMTGMMEFWAHLMM
jgi:hypothetical protein